MIEAARRSLRQQADDCRRSAEQLDAESAQAPTKRQRSNLRKRAALMRDVERWFRSRNGY